MVRFWPKMILAYFCRGFRPFLVNQLVLCVWSLMIVISQFCQNGLFWGGAKMSFQKVQFFRRAFQKCVFWKQQNTLKSWNLKNVNFSQKYALIFVVKFFRFAEMPIYCVFSGRSKKAFLDNKLVLRSVFLLLSFCFFWGFLFVLARKRKSAIFLQFLWKSEIKEVTQEVSQRHACHRTVVLFLSMYLVPEVFLHCSNNDRRCSRCQGPGCVFSLFLRPGRCRMCLHVSAVLGGIFRKDVSHPLSETNSRM